MCQQLKQRQMCHAFKQNKRTKKKKEKTWDHEFSQLAGSAGYQPSIADVFRVKRYLQSALPIELVNRIIDDASYWLHSSVTLESRLSCIPLTDKMFMRTLPLGAPGTEGDFSLVQDGAAWTKNLRLGKVDDPPRSTTLLHPCRKVEFQFWCPDKVQADETHSGPWFDASIQHSRASIFTDNTDKWPASLIFSRFDEDFCSDPVDPKPHIPYSELHLVDLETREHTIVWHYLDSCDKDPVEVREAGRPDTLDGKSLCSMEVGDCIILWARVWFDNWAKVKTTVYWAV